MEHKSYRSLTTIFVLFILYATTPYLSAVTQVWSGGGADTLASTSANWAGGIAPQNGDSVQFDATSGKSCDWDLDVELLNWNQTAGYTGTVTIWTEYPGIANGTGFTNLMISGDATLAGGTWTHRANRGVNDAWDRLRVSVGGDFTLTSTAGINVTTKGFAGGRGPGAGVDVQDKGKGASHGGVGACEDSQPPSPTYGYAAKPETLGSGTATMAGGGALYLVVGGAAQIDGIIQADGSEANRRSGSAGGAIYVEAATVSGAGTLRADGGKGQWNGTGGYSGGGGRVALVATNGSSLGDVATFARSGTTDLTSYVFGTAGTVFRKTAAGADLVIDQANRTPQTAITRSYPYASRIEIVGELPALLATFTEPPAGGGALEDAVLSLSNKARVKLTSDLLLGDFTALSADSKLDLNGHTLFLKAAAPGAGLLGTIITNDGRIVWGNAAPTVKLGLSTYNGTTVTADPVSPTGDGYYPLNTVVTLTATPAANHTFLWWKGDLPVGVLRTTHPLTVTMDGRRDLTAVVAKNDGATRTWIGEGANRNASNAANWSPATAPTSGCHVVFNEASDVECNWDLNIEPASWTQTTGYAFFYGAVANGVLGHRGLVTLRTLYPGQGAFTNLAIRGDCALGGGAWTHPANSGVDIAKERLAVTVGGDFTLDAGARVSVVNRGYASNRGPGAGMGGKRNDVPTSRRGGSHGGLGSYTVGVVLPGNTYGSITAPTTLGSASDGRGGGAAIIHAAGALAINGVVEAHADRNGDTQNQGSAGGSIYLRGASATGAGSLNAKGSVGYRAGGGGRIAVILTNSTSFANFSLNASGDIHGTSTADREDNSSAGTIYLEGWSAGAPSVRRLIVDNKDLYTPAHMVANLMPTGETYDLHPSLGGEIQDVTLEIVNQGRVKLSSSLLMGDFDALESGSTINLDGATLYLKADEPPGAFPGDYGGGTVLTNGGAIVWNASTVYLSLVATNGPNGSVSRSPEIADNLYEFGSDVTVTATPASGHAFVYWEGDVPAGSNRTDNPLVVKVDQERTLRAIFASTAADTSTWIGGGADVLASNPDNWHPHVAPSAGANIVLDETSLKEMHWDLDIPVASWTQTDGFAASYTPADGYHGWVVFKTRYPGQGTFTNFIITGDCMLNNGTWTHPVNTGDTVAADRLSVSVGGGFVLGSNAVIDVINRGFANMRGPGAGIWGGRDKKGRGGSHGGLGNYDPVYAAKGVTYGSISLPESLGSGSGSPGGGNVHVVVDGGITLNGEILANSYNGNDMTGGGSGGSVYLKGSSLEGNGLVDASGAMGYQGGGGGRIAVVLSDSAEFGEVAFDVSSMQRWSDATVSGASGTIYLEGRSGVAPVLRRLIVDNDSQSKTNVVTELPQALDADRPALRHMAIEVRDLARVGITDANVKFGDVSWVDANSRLQLNGREVFVAESYHTFTDGIEEDVVVEDGGELIWSLGQTIFIVR